MPTLANLVVNLTGNSGLLNKAVDSSVRRFKVLSRVVGRVAKRGALVGGALGGAAAAGLIAYGKRASAAIDETAKLSKAMGISETEVKALGLAAGLSGVPFKSMQTAMKTSLKGADEFARGISESKGLKQSFDDAGLSAEQVANILKTGPTKAFASLLAVVSNIEDPIKRLNAAQNLLGKRNTNVVNAAGLLSNELGKQIEFVNLFRGSTGKLSGSIEAMNDQFTVTSTALGLIGERFTVAVAGPIKDATAAFQLWLGQLIASEGGVDKFVNTTLASIGEKMAELKPVITGFAKLFEGVATAFGTITKAGEFIGQVVGTGGRGPGAVTGGQGAVTKDSLKKQDETREAIDRQTELLKQRLNAEGVNLGFGP